MDQWSSGLVERNAPTLVLRAFSILIIAAGVWLAPAHSWAQTRAYQMTLLGSVDAHIVPRPAVINYNVGVDVPTFSLGRERQPMKGPLIVWLSPSNDLTPLALVDWSRVIAVYVDEPYYGPLKQAGYPYCLAGSGAQIVQGITNTLQLMAGAVRSRAPKARFWVNYNFNEVEWMRDDGCPFNHTFIDVVSVDRYDRAFNSLIHLPGVRSYYDYFSTHRPVPNQQLALVPGTHTSSEQNDGTGAGRLPQYFAYAQDQNQACNLPLGPIGVTGFYDGCPVWIVAGFVGGAGMYTDTDGFTLYPIEHPNAQQIRAAWEQTLAIPRSPPSPDLTRFNRQWTPAALKVLLN
jgi:hypothetical protein